MCNSRGCAPRAELAPAWRLFRRDDGSSFANMPRTSARCWRNVGEMLANVGGDFFVRRSEDAWRRAQTSALFLRGVRRAFHGRGCCLRGACRVAAAPPRGQSGSSAIMLCGCVFSLLRERAFLFEARAERAGSSARNAVALAQRGQRRLQRECTRARFFFAADAARRTSCCT